MRSKSTTIVHGECDPAFNGVRAEFARGFDELSGDPIRGEIGGAMAVFIAGRSVVDLWAGYADSARQRAWARDTLANVFSTSKGITAILAHRLVDQGHRDLDVPVSRYWPEFTGADKGGISVRNAPQPSRRPAANFDSRSR